MKAFLCVVIYVNFSCSFVTMGFARRLYSAPLQGFDAFSIEAICTDVALQRLRRDNEIYQETKLSNCLGY